jgi:hypothetical protein
MVHGLPLPGKADKLHAWVLGHSPLIGKLLKPGISGAEVIMIPLHECG